MCLPFQPCLPSLRTIFYVDIVYVITIENKNRAGPDKTTRDAFDDAPRSSFSSLPRHRIIIDYNMSYCIQRRVRREARDALFLRCGIRVALAPLPMSIVFCSTILFDVNGVAMIGRFSFIHLVGRSVGRTGDTI